MPLNTARRCLPVGFDRLGVLTSFVLLVLAVQNMEASGSVAKSQEIEFKALEGSLSMMSKGESMTAAHVTRFPNSACFVVLNDVLDL